MPDITNYRKVADNPDAGWMNLQSSKILRNGLGDPILTKREEGWSMSAISKFFDLDRFTVRLFLENWDALPAEKQKEYREYMRQNNVWDLAQRVQDLFEKIEKKLESLDGRNDMLHREYIGEQRQLLNLAAQILKDAAKLEHQKQIVTIILQEIAAESPEVRDRIAARMRSVKEINLLMGGNT